MKKTKILKKNQTLIHMETPTFTYNANLPIYDVEVITKPHWYLIGITGIIWLVLLYAKITQKSSSDNRSEAIALMVFIGLLTLAIAAQLYFYIRRIQKRQTFLRTSQTAMATLVGKNRLDTALGEEYRYYLFYQFHPDFTVRMELTLNKIHTGWQMGEYYDQFKIGDPIKVAYLPDDPKRSAPIQLPDYKNYSFF